MRLDKGALTSSRKQGRTVLHDIGYGVSDAPPVVIREADEYRLAKQAAALRVHLVQLEVHAAPAPTAELP
ncbi:hypothetical protein [Streptomyces sp. NPDC004528]|uniref:hypothetical protein n=1 Tax=Streptomyces sp. NPDC004528 TaxID=3154550 RepID=UPI0033A766AE